MANCQRNAVATRKRCHICYAFYVTDIEAPLSAEYVTKIQRICSKYLFAELIGATEWTWTSSNDLPFCIDCDHYVQRISLWHDQREDIKRQISDVVDAFALKALKRRKTEMKRYDCDEIPTEVEMCLPNLPSDQKNNGANIKHPSGRPAIEIIKIECEEVKFVPPPVITIDEDEIPSVREPSTSNQIRGEDYIEIILENRPSQLSQQTEIYTRLNHISGSQNEVFQTLQFANGHVPSPKSSVLVSTNISNKVDVEKCVPSQTTASGHDSRENPLPRTRRRRRSIISNIGDRNDVANEKRCKHPGGSGNNGSPVLLEQPRNPPSPTSSPPPPSDHSSRKKSVNVGDKWKCTFCKKSFSKFIFWKRHSGRCSSEFPLELPYECTICGNTFEKEFHLKAHLRHQRSCRTASGTSHSGSDPSTTTDNESTSLHVNNM